MSAICICRTEEGWESAGAREWSSFVHRERPLPQEISALTGIACPTSAISPLRYAPSFSVAYNNLKKEIKSFKDENLASDVTLVGHNVNFDLRHLDHELGKGALEDLGVSRVVDTQQYARGMPHFPYALSLTDSVNVSFSQESVYKALFNKGKGQKRLKEKGSGSSKTKKREKNHLEQSGAHNSLWDVRNLQEIVTSPLFPNIENPPQPPVKRPCIECGSCRHTSRSNCALYRSKKKKK